MMTELGMETEVNPVQLWKVPSAISVIELGMDTDFRFWQARKACCPMEVTEMGMRAVTIEGCALFKCVLELSE